MTSGITSLKSLRSLLAVAGLALALGLLLYQGPRLLTPAVWSAEDLVAHWTAARLNVTGGNPYAPDEILALEKEVGWHQPWPLIAWNPPWTLGFLAPLGWVDFPTSRILWLLSQILVLAFCADRAWKLYGGPPGLHGWAWILTFSFFPSLLIIRLGQITVLPLLGVVGFLHFLRQGKAGWAGAALALGTIKPHLLHLVFLAVLCWAVTEQRWRLLLGGALTVLGATLAAWYSNPHVLEQYGQLLAHNRPETLMAATAGAWIRFTFGPDQFALQFLPSLLGAVWLLCYWYSHRQRWDWQEQMPILLFASVLTSAYGWSYDLVLFLIPMMQAAAWVLASQQRRLIGLALAIHVTISGLALCINAFWRVQEQYYVWMAPALLAGYLLLRWQVRKEEARTVALAGC